MKEIMKKNQKIKKIKKIKALIFLIFLIPRARPQIWDLLFF